MILENDFFVSSQDRWRTGGIQAGYRDFVLGANVYTNDPKAKDSSFDLNGLNWFGKKNRPGKNGKSWGAWDYGYVYKSPFYVGLRSAHTFAVVGYNHPVIQDVLQNTIHRWVPFGRQHYYNNYSKFKNRGFILDAWQSFNYSIYGF